MRFHTPEPQIYDGIMGWDDALIAAAVTAAATAGSAYYANEGRQDAVASQQAYNFTANANQNEIAAAQAGLTRDFANSQRGLQNQFSVDTSGSSYARAQDQANIAYWRNQANYEDAKKFSSSAYQRAMLDMRQAGLNPILAYSKGGLEMTPQAAQTQAANAGGIDVPGGGSAPSASAGGPLGTQLPQVESLLGGGAISAATQAARGVADVQQTIAQTAKTRQDTLLSAAQERQANASTALQAAQATTEGVRPDNVRAGTRLLAAQTGLSSAQTAAVPAQIFRDRESGFRSNAESEYVNERTRNLREFGPGTIGEAATAAARTGNTVGNNTPRLPGIDNLWRNLLRPFQ